MGGRGISSHHAPPLTRPRTAEEQLHKLPFETFGGWDEHCVRTA